jgi:hypothetical protein
MGRHQHRWWDGTAWTDHVSDGGVAGTDPLSTPPTPQATTTYPASGAPFGSPAPGAVPPSGPTATFGAPAPRSGSNFKVIALVAGAVLAVIVVLVLVLGGGDESGKRDQFVAGCASDGALSRSECECFLDELLDRGHSLDELEDFGMQFSENGDIPADLQSDSVEAVLACNDG